MLTHDTPNIVASNYVAQVKPQPGIYANPCCWTYSPVMSLGYRYRASTQLRYQRFEIRLEDEPRMGTPICRNLLYRWIMSIKMQRS